MLARTDTAASAAAIARDILAADRDALSEAWRHGVLQLLDDYESVRRHYGNAAELFDDAPASTGENRVDAAIAALTEHLSRRDGWPTPGWAHEATRQAEPWWFVAGLRSWEPAALVQSPAAFRRRGVFITDVALVRL